MHLPMSVTVCVCVCVRERPIQRTSSGDDAEWANVLCFMPSLHLCLSVSPDRQATRDICHHQDKVEYGMRGISNLHNKQWNSNYQPEQTIFPAVTFGPRDCSIIHCHSRLTEKKGGEKLKKRGRGQWRVWYINAGIKPVLGQIWIM